MLGNPYAVGPLNIEIAAIDWSAIVHVTLNTSNTYTVPAGKILLVQSLYLESDNTKNFRIDGNKVIYLAANTNYVVSSLGLLANVGGQGFGIVNVGDGATTVAVNTSTQLRNPYILAIKAGCVLDSDIATSNYIRMWGILIDA